MRLACLAVLALPFAVPRAAPAQRAVPVPVRAPIALDSLRVGQTIRVFSPDLAYSRRGRLEGRFGDTLLFLWDRDQELLRLPAARLTALHVAVGRGVTEQVVVRNALYGAVLGAVAGGLASALTTRGGDCLAHGAGNSCDFRVMPMAAGIAIGFAAGAGLATRQGGVDWHEVRLPGDTARHSTAR